MNFSGFFQASESGMFDFQANFFWERLIIQWLSKILFGQPADVLWNLPVWSVMQSSSPAAPAFCGMAACAHSIAASVSFSEKQL